MAGINSVPDEVKWRIAAEFAANLPILYDREFRTVLGDTYDSVEQKAWRYGKVPLSSPPYSNAACRNAGHCHESPLWPGF
jgi:hypothetical protein